MNIVDYYRGMSWRIISDYGQRTDPFSGRTVFHYGIDFGIPEENRRNGPYNIPVKTPFLGRIHATGNYGDRGLTVVQHIEGTDILAVFQHLHRIDVRKGQILQPDSSVGLVGTTGRSTGIHLHFEMRNYSSADLGRSVWGNPRNFIITKEENNMKVAVYDPGHGGNGNLTSYGATGNGLVEKNLNLQLARLTRDITYDKFDEIEIVMTRDSDMDVSFQDRADIARRAGADVLQSFHFNGFGDPRAHGMESFRWNGQLRAGTVQFHETVHAAIAKYVTSMGIEERVPGMKTANFAILRMPPCSCVLAEYGFITNPRDAMIIKRPGTLEGMAAATAEGIGEFLGLPRKQKPEPPKPPAEQEELPRIVRHIGTKIENEMVAIRSYLCELNGDYFTVTHSAPLVRALGHTIEPKGDHISIKK